MRSIPIAPLFPSKHRIITDCLRAYPLICVSRTIPCLPINRRCNCMTSNLLYSLQNTVSFLCPSVGVVTPGGIALRPLSRRINVSQRGIIHNRAYALGRVATCSNVKQQARLGRYFCRTLGPGLPVRAGWPVPQGFNGLVGRECISVRLNLDRIRLNPWVCTIFWCWTRAWAGFGSPIHREQILKIGLISVQK